MRLLLDTHTVLWWLLADPRLSQPSLAAITDPTNDPIVSAVTAWECATKARTGKLPLPPLLLQNLERHIRTAGCAFLDITFDISLNAGSLPGPHRDPFDRMLIAQALVEGIPVVSADRVFDAYGVTRIW